MPLPILRLPMASTSSLEFFRWTVLDWSGGVSAAGCGAAAGAGAVLSGAGGGGGGCLLSGMGEADWDWSGVCDWPGCGCVCGWVWLGGLEDGFCAEEMAGQETTLTASKRAKRNCEDLRIMPTSRIEN